MSYINESGLAEVTTNLKSYIDTQISQHGGGGSDLLPDFLMGNFSEYNDTAGSVKSLRSAAFYQYSKLTSVALPECKAVYKNAFYECASLTSVSLPKCSYLESLTFHNCWLLSDIELPVCLELGTSAFYLNKAKNISVPNAPFLRGSCFYSCSYLINLNIENAMSALGSQIIYSCSNLESINCGNIIYLRSQAFTHCSKLQSINVPYLESMGIYAFSNCRALSKMQLNCLTYNDVSIFNNCISLKEIEINSIGNYALSGCTSLESIYIINASVMTYPTGAFANTPILNDTYLGYYGSIYVPSDWVASYKAATGWVSISDRITALPSEFDSKYVYQYEFQASTITTIPSEKLDCELVGVRAFQSCYSLKKASLPNCSIVAGYAFERCSTINDINLPSCEFVGRYAFNNCSYISQILLPNCKIIGNSAFQECSRISAPINLPSCIGICDAAFISCHKIPSISLPKCICIMSSAFTYCSSLSIIVIGTDLSFVPYLSNSNAFGSTPIYTSTYLGYYGSIYVPDSLVSEYQTAGGWSVYSDRITGISNLPSV